MKLNKKQKRTATIASMAALLAVVLGMGGQTFAKYITTNTVADQATVAKWGVVIRSSASTPFTHGDTKVAATRANGEGAEATYVDVVAPGTKGSFDLIVEGKPEVSSKVEIALSITDISLDILNDDGSVKETYYPIVWTLGNETYRGKDEVATLMQEVNALSNEYAVNTSIDTSVSLSWAWAFEKVENNPATTHIVDEYDTILGDIAAGKTVAGYKGNLTLAVSLAGTVTQLD